jgi:outer membrane protein assembly factor BamB
MTQRVTLPRRSILLLPIILSGCGLLDWIGDEEKKSVPGKREPVLAPSRGLQIDAATDVTLPPVGAPADWPQFGGGPSHVGGNRPGGLTRAWATGIGEGGAYRARLTAQPLVGGDRIFTMDTDGAVEAFDLSNGHHVWRTETKAKKSKSSNIGGGIALAGGRIYAATGRAETLAIDAASGHIIWRNALPTPARSSPTVVGDMMFLCTIDDNLLGVTIADGRVIWAYQATQGNTGTLGQAAPAFADGLVVAGFESGDLSAVRADSGTLAWTDNMGGVKGTSGLSEFASVRGAPVIDGGLVFAIGLGGLMAALDLRSGRRVWERDVAGANTPWLAGDIIYVVSTEQKLAAINKEDGLVHWVTDLPRFRHPKRTKGLITWSGPALIGGKLILVSDHAKMAVVDPISGALVTSADIADTASVPPIAARGTVLVLTDDATLTAYK